MTHTCTCGKPATLVADWHHDGHQERLLLCSVTCPTVRVPGTMLDVVVEPRDFDAVMRARPCWCPMRKHGIVRECPEHGRET